MYFKLQKSNENDYVSLNINKKAFTGGLAWIKDPKKDMVVTFSYLHQSPPQCSDAPKGDRRCGRRHHIQGLAGSQFRAFYHSLELP